MRRLIQLFSLLAIATLIVGSSAWAQEDEFTLETVVVTAEKRSVAIQELPSSVVALAGEELATQGKITTEQILETIPNLSFRDGYGANPDGNIAIRGIQRTQESRSVNEALPATTAVYVDGVYQGIGGHYDVSRVEILRGPQGTLYGRSATGGVVSFYTNDPKLKEFSGNVSVEAGSDALVNAEGALNVPLGEKFALRAAGHWYSRDGYLEDPMGGHVETKEGRLKVLFQPNDAFDIVAHISMQETVEWGGGYSAGLIPPDPDTIHYDVSYGTPTKGAPELYNQYGATANYDFGDMILTWIGGYHDYDNSGLAPEEISSVGAKSRETRQFPTNWYHMEEIRLASDTEGPLTWLVGANYFQHEYDWTLDYGYTYYPPGVDPALPDGQGPVDCVYQWAAGAFENYGIFTEESFELRDDFRVTAGLRYDYTEFIQSMIFMENVNDTGYSNWVFYPPIWAKGELYGDVHEWHNVTYKLRFEYDVTPDNMLYFTTATGFLPGYAAIGPDQSTGEIMFIIRIMDEQKMTSYELGSKNQFLDDRLRLNYSAFYYDLEGYPELFSLVDEGRYGQQLIIETPIEVIGTEVEAEYLPTMYDRISFSVGFMRPEIAGYPDTLTWQSGLVTPGQYCAMLKVQPGHAQIQGSLAYDHTFALANGATLVPRAEVHYTGEHYLSQMNFKQVEFGLLPYAYQDAYMLFNANLTWTSADQKYSVSGWVRNAFNEEYKDKAGGFNIFHTRDLDDPIGVTPGDPRTFGMMVKVKF